MMKDYFVIALAKKQEQQKKAEEAYDNLINTLRKNAEFEKLYKEYLQTKFAKAKCEFENKDAKQESLKCEALENKLKLNNKNFTNCAKYSCKACCDSGMINGNYCKCTEKIANELRKSECGFSQCKAISKINTDLYCENTKKIVEKLCEWSKKFPNVVKPNLLLTGKTGVGKSYLAGAIGCEILEKNHSVLFVNAFDLNQDFLKERKNFDGDEINITKYLEVDLLIIDDLGVEAAYNNVTENYLYLLLSLRDANNKSTIITTNLKLEAIEDNYGQRIFSRICSKQKTIILKIDSEDLRLKIN